MNEDKMPAIVEKQTETEEEDMEQETPESDKTSEDDSGTGSASEGEDSSVIDDEEYEKRKTDFLDDMADLERQFNELKEQLYKERVCQVEAKLQEVRDGRAPEYLVPLEQLRKNMEIRIEVSGILRQLRIQGIKNKCDSEETAALQHMKSEKIILYDTVKAELEEKIRRLEEDRHNIDISSDLWNESQTSKKNKKKSDPFNPDRRRKPVTVSGPYIVYMLKDMEIIEDWTAIKKAIKQQSQKKKSDLMRS
ncbi:breast cancer metastasis-suppressor 1-like protein [Liolophura sinensis]|uniref:breast cancer metastasis-suppressor 1-like protein n=1 Tax=Liolophura sinensis TaxID=3198878 RepID=UPI003157FE25